MLSKSILISTSIVLVASCGPQPIKMVEMSDSITATLNETTKSIIKAERSPIELKGGFAKAIRAAVEANDGYHAAVALETEALGRRGVTESALRPQFQGNAMVGGIRNTDNTAQDSTNTGVAGGVNLSQFIYDGGATVATINQATAEVLASRAAREERGNEIALQAARAWIDVWQFQERLALLRRSSAETNDLMAQIERMVTDGLLDRAALESVRGQILDIQLEEARLQSDLGEAKVRFERFFNQDVTTIGPPDEVITLSEAVETAQAWQESPSLKRNAAEVLIAENAVRIAEAAFRPRAGLKAGLSSPIKEGESSEVSVGLSLDYTFGDGGRRRAQLDAASAHVAAVKAQLADAQKSLQAELQTALTRADSIERSMPLLAERQRLSEVEAKTARSQIATGQSNLSQLVDAHIASYQAEDRCIMMEAERQSLRLSLAAMTGLLGTKLGLDAPAAL